MQRDSPSAARPDTGRGAHRNIGDNFLATPRHQHLVRGLVSGLPGIAWLKYVSPLPVALASIIDGQLKGTELQDSRSGAYGGSRSTQAES